MYDLTGKIALVTGMGGPVHALGNGKAIAILLADKAQLLRVLISMRRLAPTLLPPLMKLGCRILRRR